MDVRSRNFKLAVTIALSVVVSVCLAAHYRKRRKQTRRRQSSTCYLDTGIPKKPQSSFKRVLADNSYAQFKHLKLHGGSAGGDCTNVHPYKEEIGELLKNLNTEFIELFDGEMVTLEDSDCIWVEKRSQLEELVEVLSKERVFGVDTEQHSLRSYLGFTALIQISTKKMDFLVDTIALHDVMGILQPVFANPRICKVFHGADNDILWLQRDFHIYVVNLFDTAKACDVLSKAQKSLAHLLEVYCGVSKNKLLQREDWRLRPLSPEMVEYARADAHYLLYIAKCLVSELKQYASENPSCIDEKFHFVLEAMRRSNAACMQLYAKDVEAFPGESAATSIISRYSLDQRSFHLNVCDTKENCSCHDKFQILVRRLCSWRDMMARVHDESLRYVLSDQAIGALATTVPTTEMDIYDTISAADKSSDSTILGSFIQTPSPVVCSHVEDFDFLFFGSDAEVDDLCYVILQRHLGPEGNCPLSIYNYYLLSETSLKMTKKRPVTKQNGSRTSKVVARKKSRELFVQKFSCKSPVYHNCRIYANDGRLLCYCDRKKLEWYINRGLAKLVEDDPPAIKLLFEPKGRPEDEGNDFYIQSKKNICVGCGEGNHYLRYRIIPSCYRMHFPEHLKSHRSHDIVLLCVDCHEIAHAAAEKCKRQIAKDFGIPLYVRKVIVSDQVKDATESLSNRYDEERGVSPLQLRTAAMALLRHGSRMPPNRREELIQIVEKYYGGREISNEDLERALLVGMSPHERRRLEKKKALFRQSTSRGVNVSQSTTEDVHSREDVSENLSGMDVEASGPATNSNSIGDDANCNMVDSDVVSCVPVSEADVVSDIQNSPSKATNLGSAFNFRKSKHDSKYSLLGHGPHGKQVVEYLLNEFGEDGILQFCQRWRQVFVEAVHPRFLPAGWDVNHSGRRDFGDFSVYKPVKKNSEFAEEGVGSAPVNQ
ncbi:OLC1v1025002C1 [Oldenlandia corymbosa var. corymbosa]|uniref:OLC1v1025002C1 n=1 Tax=Oldenlandia corymbosa var. corymbosa TaxID=529605 RepID=A0AAV1C3U7_OLDCO|nr:OLC1v1025002C1 [Oldenlandia corymbosa var. corymbosa]